MQSFVTRVAALAWSALASACPTPTQAQFTGSCEDGARRPATRALVGTTFVAGNAVLYEYHRSAWWSGDRRDFHVVQDWAQPFRDQDKLAHALGGYHLTRVGSGLLRAACMGSRKATWVGAAHALALQLQIEIWDGMQATYGFSPPDLLFNVAGTAYAVAQQRSPRLQAVKPTMSYDATDFARNPERWPTGTQASVAAPNSDYSGQTYWLSTDVDALLPPELKPLWPAILRVSVGHSITDWMDRMTGEAVRARRRIVLSVDLDPEKLPGDHPVWKQVKRQLSYYRLPAPALVVGSRVDAVGWYR